MKRLVLSVLIALLSHHLLAQEVKPNNDADEMLKAYIEAAKPVAEHERLQALAGKWNVTLSFWMTPGGAPMTGSGTATARLVLGGRFLQIDATTDKPVPSESITMLGFDRRTNDYTLVGFDTLGTYYITAAGKHEAPAKGVVFRGSYLQPPAMREQKYRFVWESPSATEHSMKLYFALPGDAEMLVAETRYTKAR